MDCLRWEWSKMKKKREKERKKEREKEKKKKKERKKERKEGRKSEFFSAITFHVFGQDPPYEQIVFFSPSFYQTQEGLTFNLKAHHLSNPQQNQIHCTLGNQVSFQAVECTVNFCMSCSFHEGQAHFRKKTPCVSSIPKKPFLIHFF